MENNNGIYRTLEDLYSAIKYNNYDVVDRILNEARNNEELLNKIVDKSHIYLGKAICNYPRSWHIIRQILNLPGVRVNDTTEESWPPLHLACRYGALKVVEALLANPNTDVNYVNDRRCTALTEALHMGRTGVAKFLLSVPGINVNAAHPHAPYSPLYWAVAMGYRSLTRSLLEHKDIVIDYKKLPDNAEKFFKSLKVELTCE